MNAILLPKDLNERDFDLMAEQADVVDVLIHVIHSEEVIAKCRAELEEAKQNGYRF